MQGLTALLATPKSHDLVSIVQNWILPRAPDTITINVDLIDEIAPALSLAIVPQRLSKKLRHDSEDLQFLAKTFGGDRWGLPKNMTVVTDTETVVNSLLSREVVKLIESVGDWLEFVHVSDCYIAPQEVNPYDIADPNEKSVPVFKKMLRLKFKVRFPPEYCRPYVSLPKLNHSPFCQPPRVLANSCSPNSRYRTCVRRSRSLMGGILRIC